MNAGRRVKQRNGEKGNTIAVRLVALVVADRHQSAKVTFGCRQLHRVTLWQPVQCLGASGRGGVSASLLKPLANVEHRKRMIETEEMEKAGQGGAGGEQEQGREDEREEPVMENTAGLDATSNNLPSPEPSPLLRNNPVHDWKSENTTEKDFFDDGTMTYFWRAHTLTTLVFMICFLLYEALSPADEDMVDNTKRGIVASLSAFILLGVTVTPDGPFKRPHPAIWRLTFIISIVYELGLIFVLYQSVSGARQLLKHIDPKLGEPMEEKDYGGNCRLYDHERPDDPFHNIKDKLDLFVPLHFFGWWMKTLLLRDWWLCWVISVMFELLEYTLEHQLPNFSECWWDHWIMDALVCNGLGIYCGLQSLKYFTMKTYHWRGLWNIPTYRGKLRRIIGQFGPYVWVDYDWKPLSSLGRWFSVLGIIAIFLLAELNTFYLKFVLWVEPGHWVNLVRLIFILPWGAVALREVFQFLDDPDFTKFGRQSWLFLSIVCTELLIVIKFGWDTVTIPFPRHVISMWLGFLVLLMLWTVWNFYIDPHTFKVDSKDIERRREHWSQVRAIETKLSPSESRPFDPQFFFEKFIQRTKQD